MGGHTGATWQIQLNCLCATVMRSFVKLLGHLYFGTVYHYAEFFILALCIIMQNFPMCVGVCVWRCNRFYCTMHFSAMCVITCSNARSASLWYLFTQRPMGVKFGTEEGTFGPLHRAKFHPHRCNDKGVGPPKL